MNSLKSMVNELAGLKDFDKQVEILKGIMTELLRNYEIKVTDDLIIYPVTVEAYYYHEDHFRDESVHKDKLQKNNFGGLYFHKNEDGEYRDFVFKPDKRVLTGMDVCLSDGDFHFGVLIKEAFINNNGKVTQERVKQTHIVGHIVGRYEDINETSMTPENKSKLSGLEEKKAESLFTTGKKREGDPKFDKRKGLSKGYIEAPLQASLEYRL